MTVVSNLGEPVKAWRGVATPEDGRFPWVMRTRVQGTSAADVS
jgi:hypothetical protein